MDGSTREALSPSQSCRRNTCVLVRREDIVVRGCVALALPAALVPTFQSRWPHAAAPPCRDPALAAPASPGPARKRSWTSASSARCVFAIEKH